MQAIIDHLSNEKKVDDDKEMTSNLMGVSFATDICDEPTISNGVTPLSREARSTPVFNRGKWLSVTALDSQSFDKTKSCLSSMINRSLTSLNQ